MDERGDANDDDDHLAERAKDATAWAATAFERLLFIAERGVTDQAHRVARFVAASYDGTAYAMNLFDLRGLDEETGDDVLTCLDALRWAQAELCALVSDGEARVRLIIERWGLTWPDEGSVMPRSRAM